MKSLISYVPHGINENHFRPITEADPLFEEYKKFKGELLRGKEYDFVLLFNSRNIRRKSIPDTMLAFKTFLDTLNDEDKDKCVFILHTQPIDDNGTNLLAVGEMLFGEEFEKRIIFSDKALGTGGICYLYNMADATILLSSNEGWGLSMTESLMCGTMIIGNVTGGIQDQMKFQDHSGNWIEIKNNFSTNHQGKYKKCGQWALPVFPSNISIQGSVPTPYIADDRCDYIDAATAISEARLLGKEERDRRGLLGREWVTSKEAGMSSQNMASNFMMSMDYLLKNYEPRVRYQIIKIKPRKKRYLPNPISF
jgi:hypothetical protein